MIIREQHVDGDVDPLRVPDVLVAVGEGQLDRLDLQVDRVGARRVHRPEVQALEDVEGDQHGDALAVGRALVHRIAIVIVDRDRRDDLRLEAGEVLQREIAVVLV
jgi:hypothetical protein